MNDKLIALTRPFPAKYVHTNPSGGGSYVKHHVVEQRLIQVFGEAPQFEQVEIHRGDVAAIPPNPNGSSKRAKEGRPALSNVIVGVTCRMTVSWDGGLTFRVYEDTGDCEQPHNWDTDGARLKDAMSDAYKRCAMRFGCGLHLWSQEEYFLHDALVRDNGSNDVGGSETSEPSAAVLPAPAAAPQDVKADESAPGPTQSGSSASQAELFDIIEQAVLAKPSLGRSVQNKVNALATKLEVPFPAEGWNHGNLAQAPAELLQRVVDEMQLKNLVGAA